MPNRDGKTHLTAIGRSFDIYYRDTARTTRMDALHAQFIRKGGLAFDVGAHVGDRTGSFLRLGAHVVSAEPQPTIFRALRLLYGKCDRATLYQQAIGRDEGALELYVNSTNPTVTTASSDLIFAAQSADMWQGQVWDHKISVSVTTLDRLINVYGMPDFIKIDVEGHELSVLEGLNHQVSALSFEFTTIQKTLALDCLDRLKALGDYAFNISLGEEHVLKHPKWISAEYMKAELHKLPLMANSGDIFARLW